MEKSKVRKLWFRRNRGVELVIRHFLWYFYTSNKNYLTKHIMASKCKFMKNKNAFIVKLRNLA
jgi:hypothetical protein